jgi:hypothetical protein
MYGGFENNKQSAGFEVLTAVVKKGSILWDIAGLHGCISQMTKLSIYKVFTYCPQHNVQQPQCNGCSSIRKVLPPIFQEQDY